MKFQKILVAIDDSSLCPAVFTAALELAQSNRGAIKLLHSLPPEVASEPTLHMPVDTGIQPGFVSNDYQAYQTQQILLEKQVEDAQTVLQRYTDEAVRYGVPTESDYKVGEAGYWLCEVAKEWSADLIVVGRRGLTGLSEALLGSVSNYVVHHAPCSVLVIQQVESEPLEPAVADVSSIVSQPPLGQEPA